MVQQVLPVWREELQRLNKHMWRSPMKSVNDNSIRIIIAIAIPIMVLVVLMLSIYKYAGLFFVEGSLSAVNGEMTVEGTAGAGDGNEDEGAQDDSQSDKGLESSPVKHIQKIEYLNKTSESQGLRQVVNLLEIDVSAPGVRIVPVLSSDLIYGFEILSSMVSRKNAYAAVNGGFYTLYGLPSGMVVIDGQLITLSTGKFPVFTLTDGIADITDFNSELTIRYKGSDGRLGTINADCMNTPVGEGLTAVYTPLYGRTNRMETQNMTVTIRNGIVEDVGIYPAETSIPVDGMLLTFALPMQYSGEGLPVIAGDSISLIHSPDFIKTGTQAYECGSWIVRDGQIVIGDKDIWVGVLTNHDPRTVIGIREDGTVLLITVDGRQPGYSEGMTGRELGEYLLENGVKEAAMLDGGASTEMIVDGEIVNKPSFKSQERPLAGALLIFK